ncbi:putative F420-0 ABC transporter substrate-binding protein [Devosia sp. RR2S18]|nr:putative F420-0 ABC transporter substrate-binding protein [Devosia sp. RR2S18]WIJ23610.1 putative F420-0 ABC transporter substrate-binding protein [Devosia sp. RR2S18]
MRSVIAVALALLLASPGVSRAQETYPLAVQNCGMEVIFEAPPERVVAIKSTSAELLLALGLEDRMIGLAFLDAPVPTRWAEAASAIPVISEKLPSQEVVLELEPDFIYGGWESNFSADGAGERQTLTTLGIDSYVSPAACRSHTPEKLTFEALFSQIEEIGDIFGVTEAAAGLTNQLRTELDSIELDERGLTALWYSSGTKTPYVGAGNGAPQMIFETVGLENIFDGTDESWISASWETVVDADPDVIVLVDSEWNSAEQKRRLLAENPVTSQLSAVANQRYLVVPFPASEAGVRNVGAAADMAQQLDQLTFEQ